MALCKFWEDHIDALAAEIKSNGLFPGTTLVGRRTATMKRHRAERKGEHSAGSNRSDNELQNIAQVCPEEANTQEKSSCNGRPR